MKKQHLLASKMMLRAVNFIAGRAFRYPFKRERAVFFANSEFASKAVQNRDF
jgi:hypothetical protein